METMSAFFPSLPLQPGGLFWMGLALIGAGLCGEVCRSRLGLPRIVGYALAGLLGGLFGRDVIAPPLLEQTRWLIEMALALTLFELGHRVTLGWLRANPGLVITTAVESLLTGGIVAWSLQLMGVAPAVAMIAGGIAISTSPTIVLQLKNELRADGQVTQRLLAMSALNSILAAAVVQIAVGGLHSVYGNVWAALLHPVYLLCGSLALAWVMGVGGHWLYRRMSGDDHYAFLLLVGLVLFTLALTKLFRLSIPLTLLLAGVVFKNRDVQARVWPAHYGSAGSLLIVVMIVSLGLPLKLEHWLLGGLAAAMLVAVRFAVKFGSVMAFGTFSGLSLRQCMALGLSLAPMSGLAFLLMTDAAQLYPAAREPLQAILLCAIAILELVGPVLTAWGLRLAGEVRAPEGRS